MDPNIDPSNLDPSKLDGDALEQIGKMMGNDPQQMNKLKQVMKNPQAMKQMKKMLNQTLAAQGLIDPTESIKSKKIGRNEKCPCGSGKKYKMCCIDNK